ncbi:hypothetical protein [Mycolicibacillus trivialis]|uniref:hypothetical protein n=1 Tax=Mycolicibacillus trivialis TaxID=1798 RepID=UPI0010548E01|nr:hypothetical protein [Mycolicibacillus trivialis]
MADTPPRGLPPTPAAPFWPPTPPNPPRSSPSWLGGAALTVATAALAVGILGWFRPAPPPPAQEPVFTEQQVEAAKERACAAFELVQRGVRLQTGGGEQGGISTEATMAEAQAANARLSINAGGWYLRFSLTPATPTELTEDIESLSAILLDLAANYLAGGKDENPTLAHLLDEGELAFQKVEDICG